MTEFKCDMSGCAERATVHFNRAQRRSRVEMRRFCHDHGRTFVERYYQSPINVGVGVGGTTNLGIAFDIDFTFYDEAQREGSCRCYLVEVGGTRRIGMAMGPFEWYAIDLELQRYQAPRPLTHRAMASVIGLLGGNLSEVFIDKFFPSQHLFEAKLHIGFLDALKILDVRPSDAIVLALIANVPIIVAHHVLAVSEPA